ncbi:MAG: M20 metallopeptidase family protein [Calditrichia bacterium]
MILNKAQTTLENLSPFIREFREDLHRHPELSWKEHRTTERVRTTLEEVGFKDIRQPLDTGLIADYIVDKSKPFILLRADIDALPIQDLKSVSYASTNQGVCHACAHDVHTSVILGTALAINQLKPELAKNLRFVFQPAEEPIPSGAPEMVKAGVLENVSHALGLHMEPSLRVGQVTLASGFINMQSIRLDLKLSGAGGHSARPHETADLLWVASRIIQDGYQMMYRGLNHLDTTVILTFTEISAAQGYNVIPNELTLTGTLRLADPQKKDVALARLKDLMKTLEQDNNCSIELKVTEGSPAIHNAPELMQQLDERLQKDFWYPMEVIKEHRTPGGDDFSHYSKQVPSAMIKFGSKTDEMTASVHEGLFDVPPESIEIATAFFVHQLLRWE